MKSEVVAMTRNAAARIVEVVVSTSYRAITLTGRPSK